MHLSREKFYPRDKSREHNEVKRTLAYRASKGETKQEDPLTRLMTHYGGVRLVSKA